MRTPACRWRGLAGGLLGLAIAGPASAEPPTLTSLLKPLDLASYRGSTQPPAFDADTLDARRLALSGLRGKVVVVNFWASWCLECRPEMPVLERLHRELTGRGLAVIGVNARESRAAIARYARELALTFPLVVDPDGAINMRYGVIGLPTTFLIARDGRAVGFAVGAREWDGPTARALLDALLGEPAPASR